MADFMDHEAMESDDDNNNSDEVIFINYLRLFFHLKQEI